MSRLEGVDSVEVSLNEGVARLGLEPGNRVRLEHLREVVENGGFTPREAAVFLVGTPTLAEDGLLLQGGDAEWAYAFRLSFKRRPELEEVLRERQGSTVEVEGIVPPPVDGEQPPELEVTSVVR